MGREMRELLAIRRLLLTPKQRLAKPLLARGGQTGAAAHCSRRADILSALDAHQPLSGSCEHWTPKADRMSARHSFGRDGGGSARMRPLRTRAQLGCLLRP